METRHYHHLQLDAVDPVFSLLLHCRMKSVPDEVRNQSLAVHLSVRRQVHLSSHK
jgi:hypothetical protein